MAELTLQEVKDHLAVDFDDEATDRMLTRLMSAADAYLIGAVGKDYPKEDERAKQIALCLISDLYEKRGLNPREAANENRLIQDFTLQLQMEVRRGQNDKTNPDSKT